MLDADQMRSLPQCFLSIADPRRAQGRRHRLPMVLGIATGAILCGMRGYKAISDWADALGQQARRRFGCRRERGHYVVPSEFVIRDCLVRIESGALDRALATWNQAWGAQDHALAIDGKTMKNAVDEAGDQAHILSVCVVFRPNPATDSDPKLPPVLMQSCHPFRSKAATLGGGRSRH